MAKRKNNLGSGSTGKTSNVLRLEILNSLNPIGIELHISEIVSKYADDPFGPSRARAAILELKEDGALEISLDGNVRRNK